MNLGYIYIYKCIAMAGRAPPPCWNMRGIFVVLEVLFVHGILFYYYLHSIVSCLYPNPKLINHQNVDRRPGGHGGGPTLTLPSPPTN